MLSQAKRRPEDLERFDNTTTNGVARSHVHRKSMSLARIVLPPATTRSNRRSPIGMDQPADILNENERLRNRLQQVEDVLRAFRSGDVDALIDQNAASAANRLRVSEIRYRRLLEAAHDGILIVDPATREIIDANPFMINLLG